MGERSEPHLDEKSVCLSVYSVYVRTVRKFNTTVPYANNDPLPYFTTLNQTLGSVRSPPIFYILYVYTHVILSIDVQQFAEALQTEVNSSESTQSDKPKEEDSKNDKRSASDKEDKDSSA